MAITFGLQNRKPQPAQAPAPQQAADAVVNKDPAKLEQNAINAKNYQGAQQPTNQQAPAQASQYPNQWSLQGGFDMSGPGAAEDAYARYGSQLAAPGATEAYAGANTPGSARSQTASGQYAGTYNPMAGQSALQGIAGQGGAGQDAAQAATASGQYWNSLQGQSNVPKDMGAYYDRQYEKGAQRINNQAGARGMYNSSAALDQQTQFASDLGGQQARDEAQYGLQSSDLNNRIMSGAASAADSAGMSRYNSGANVAQAAGAEGTSRYLAGLQGAGQADTAGLGMYGAGLQGAQASDNALTGRLGLLGQGAMGADQSRQGRVGSVYNNLSGLAGDLSGVAGASYADGLAADQGLYDMGQQMSLGAGLANLTGVQNQSALNMAGAQAVGQGATNAATTALQLSKK
jgi:hypothetical protein